MIRLAFAAVLCFLLTQSAYSANPPLTPNYQQTHSFFVATNGSDSNPGTYSQPFLTLGKCQTAMRASTSQKTCFIRGGNYSSAPKVTIGSPTTALLELTSSDNGTTWSYYPPDGVNTAIFDGGNTNTSLTSGFCQNTTYTDWGIHVNAASNITINGLTFQHFTFGGVLVQADGAWGNWVPSNSGGTSDKVTITNNLIQNIQNGQNINNACSTTAPFTGWPNGANTDNTMGSITVMGHVTNLSITHNAIENTMGMGIDFETFTVGDKVDGANVSYNFLYNTDFQCNDCGAIHFYLSNLTTNNPASAVGAVIQYNYIRDCGGSYQQSRPTSSRCIYLDDVASGFTVSGNVMAGVVGSAANVSHGGHNNAWSGNIVDLGNGVQGQINVGLYQNSGNCTSGASCMTGNTWQHNIIIDNTSIANGTWNIFTPDSPLTGGNDLTHEYGTGSINDNSYNVSSSDPSFQLGWGYVLASNSPAYSSPVSFPTQPSGWGTAGFWGPVGFAIPQIGSPPSYPH